MGRRRLVTDKTYCIALKILASAREMKRCVEFFHLMDGEGYGYNVAILNKVVESLCRCKLVVEAKYVMIKLKDCVKPNEVTYKWLVFGFCDVGDLVEASKVWNMMVDEGFDPVIDAVEKMMDTLFKTNRFDEAIKLFQSIRVKRMDELGVSTYRLMIKWMSKEGKIRQAHVMFDGIRERGIAADILTMASLVYGLSSRGRVREAYMVMEGIEKSDVSVYHGLIKGILRLRRAGLVKAGKSLEATKYVEIVIDRGLEVPRFDYNRFLHYFSNEEDVLMFENMSKKLREVGLFDLADIFQRYGEKMAAREKRRDMAVQQEGRLSSFFDCGTTS
ncbi:hypothetical protein RJ640_007981 [Escallonia rubra]|uniref:Pentatricopeptide repeat-containing protein n=1 Tax=Escallonia rubra TaxID=112253 RepID=A0AA88QAJ3_9ASTE|nr:hypothetical protein RJ640_007981 [Escallonia rubra]